MADMEAGAATEGFTVILAERGLPVPHELKAATEIVPPLVPAVISIEFDVEVPVHPAGKVQV